MNLEIARYTYYLWSSRAGTAHAQVASMMLYDAADNYVAAVAFHDEGATLPPAAMFPGTSILSLHYRMRDLPAIVDMLRHERPVFVQWNEGAYADVNGCITTLKEPVGEGERSEAPTPERPGVVS